MKNGVTCAKCKQKIEYRDELVACLIIIILQAYHEECYTKKMKDYVGIGIRFPTTPLNANMWSLSALIFGPLGMMLLLFGKGTVEVKWLGVICLFPAIYRLLAYFLYERHLIDQIDL